MRKTYNLPSVYSAIALEVLSFSTGLRTQILMYDLCTMVHRYTLCRRLYTDPTMSITEKMKVSAAPTLQSPTYSDSDILTQHDWQLVGVSGLFYSFYLLNILSLLATLIIGDGSGHTGSVFLSISRSIF